MSTESAMQTQQPSGIEHSGQMPSSTSGPDLSAVLSVVRTIEAKRAMQPKRVEPTRLDECVRLLHEQTFSPRPILPSAEEIENQRVFRRGQLMRMAGFQRREMEAMGSIAAPDECPEWWNVYRTLLDELGSGMMYALVGGFGVGKTVMVACIAWHCCDRLSHEPTRNGPHYTTARKMYRRILATMRDDATETEQQVIADLTNRPLLIIDEAHERSQTEYSDKTMREIIDLRYGHKADTILISNLKQEEFEKSIGGSAVDRLNHAGGVVFCNWPSFRKPGGGA